MTGADTPKRVILVIDDDAFLGESLRDGLSDASTEVVCASSGGEGVVVCGRRVVDIVLLDQQLPDGTGADFCASILEHSEHTKIIFMTAYPSFENAVAALKLGACDYLAKPFEFEELQMTVNNAVRLLELENIERLVHHRRREEAADSTVIGSSAELHEGLEMAKRAAAAGAPILILGETGTGKTLLARHLHYNGAQRMEPFVSLNCAALPDTLAESELFGHERGAFTGAEKTRRGIFEIAGNGTVLLDEIGAMALSLQAKLLGVLEDKVVRRLGGEIVRPVNARIMAATNRDLEASVSEGTFRRDLFFRLGVVPIHVPPLRRRAADLPELCDHLIRSICGRRIDLGPDEISRLAAYHWPGNVRELRNVIERALIVHGEHDLRPSSLLGASAGEVVVSRAHDGPESKTLDEVEREHIACVLEKNRGNLTRTAKDLGIALSTLKRKIRNPRGASRTT